MNPLWLLTLLFAVGLVIALILGFFSGLPFLIAEILTGLLLSAIVGVTIGYLLCRNAMLRWASRATLLTSELESRSHELSRQRERIAALEKALLEKDAAAASLKNRQQKLHDELTALKAKLEALEREREAIHEANQQLQQTLAERDAHIARLKAELER